MSALLEQRLSVLESRVAALEAGGGWSRASGGGGGAIASDYEMGGQYGDKPVKKDPKRWLEGGGESYAGCTMSQCPSDYLMVLAEFYDWQADMDDKKGKTFVNKKGETVQSSTYGRKDAALARGWAKRNASAQAAPQAPSAPRTTQPRQSVPQGPQKPVQDDYGDTPYDDDGSIPF